MSSGVGRKAEDIVTVSSQITGISVDSVGTVLVWASLRGQSVWMILRGPMASGYYGGAGAGAGGALPPCPFSKPCSCW